MTDRRVPRCTRAYDPRLREAVGAYLLGALEPAEADEVAAHLSECESCRADYAELADLVPLMAMVTEQEALLGPVRPEPAVLGRVLDTSRREGAQFQAKGTRKPPVSTAASFATAGGAPAAAAARRRPGRTRLALTAACVLLAAAGSVVGVRMSTHTTPSNSWSATVMVSSYGTGSGGGGGGNGGTDADIMVVADVTPTSWGSKISLQMNNVPNGYKCSMVVWGTDGRREPAGSWTAPAGQTSFTIPATSSFSPDHISAIDVNLPGGVNLLRVDHP